MNNKYGTDRLCDGVDRLGVMIDIETLGTSVDSIVVEATFLPFCLDTFEFYKSTALSIRPSVDHQSVELSRNISASTLRWWLRMEDTARLKLAERLAPAVQQEMYRVDIKIQEWLMNLSESRDEQKRVEYWARGPHFDIAILDSLFAANSVTVPWKYDMVRDIRTIMAAAGIRTADVDRDGSLPEHDALSDCIYQIECLKESMQVLRAAD